MTPATTLALRRGLLGVVVAVSATVLWSLRRPPQLPVTAGAQPDEGNPTGTTVQELVYRKFKAEHEGFVLRARKMIGQEGDESRFEGVVVNLDYVARQKAGKATITADECHCNLPQQRAVLRGKVHIVTEDGLELDTESLTYRGDKGLAKTADPVKFRRNEVSGSSTGMEYRAEKGGLDMPADAFVRIESETGPPTEIRSERAWASRSDALMRFEGSVRVTQGSDSLTAGRLNLNLTADLGAVYRAVAIDEAELRTSGSTPATQAMGGAKARGPRVLKGKKIDVWFREDHSLQEVTAGPDAELDVLPAPGEPRERRHMKARIIAFRFDAQGRLEELQAQKEAVLTSQPLPDGSVRTVTCNNLLAVLDPESGEARTVDFDRDVTFRDDTRRGQAQKAKFDGHRNTLLLWQDPEVVDEEQGSDLKAETIEITNGTGDIAARNNVRHTLTGKSAGKGLPGAGDVPTVVVAKALDYDGRAKIARYTGGALLRSGRDEVRGARITIEEPVAGQRRLLASGDVVSLLNPRPKPGESQKPQPPVEARAQDMVYEETKNQIVYTGEAKLKQGTISTASPKATLNLNPDGNSIKTLVAGEPVEVVEGVRHASGGLGTYTPDDGTVVLVGDNVVLSEPERQVTGRTVTFHQGDDRIFVDGEEQSRTETVIRRLPKPPSIP
jgi:LPS export ABC transporter protein LptC/lipopolysaccharide transport protein LptA